MTPSTFLHSGFSNRAMLAGLPVSPRRSRARSFRSIALKYTSSYRRLTFSQIVRLELKFHRQGNCLQKVNHGFPAYLERSATRNSRTYLSRLMSHQSNALKSSLETNPLKLLYEHLYASTETSRWCGRGWRRKTTPRH